MKKFFLLFVALVFISCKEEVKQGINPNPLPTIPGTCRTLLPPNKEPHRLIGSTEPLKVKLHFETFILLQDGGILVSNEFDKYKNLTETTIQIISVKDLKSAIQEAQKNTREYKVRFTDDHVCSVFEENGWLYIRTDGQLRSYKLDRERYFLQIMRDGYNWFLISNPIWEY